MTMTLKAVIFGSIGSFSETSRIQLESFNEALLQNGLKQQWDEKEYIEFLKIQGGLNLLKKFFWKAVLRYLKRATPIKLGFSNKNWL